MDFDAALAYLDDHVNLEATAGRVEGLSLERMQRLVAAMGSPQGDYPVVHVTGTNGKGSTARMVTALLAAHGLSVGTYTSPHLDRLNERLAWNGVAIDDDALAAVISDVARTESMIDAENPASYFELLTAAAFRWFADLAVDVAVVEVGLLGRWDATNVVDAAVAVVTNVGRDHTDGGEGWRSAVAREKAGIVKPGSRLVLGETSSDLLPIFEAVAGERLWLAHRDFGCVSNQLAVGGRWIDLRTPGASYDQLFLPVHGAHQGNNAAVAVTAVEAFLGRPPEEEVVAEALAGLSLPGRFEVLGHRPLLVVDGAHNPDGATTLAATLNEGFAPAGRRWFVIGMLSGRDPVAMLEGFGVSPDDELVVCTPDSPRAMPAATLAEVASSIGVRSRRVDRVGDALAAALDQAGPDDAVIVAGSLYVVGAARSWCRAEGRSPVPG